MGKRFNMLHKRLHRMHGSSAFCNSSPTLELWAARLLCLGNLWEIIDVSDMYDSDPLPQLPWFRKFRDELNFAFIVHACGRYLSSGYLADVPRNFLEHADDDPRAEIAARIDRDEARSEGRTYADEENDDFVPVKKRLSRLQEITREAIAGEASLFDFDDRRTSPDKLGNYWKLLTANGLVKHWLGLSSPVSLNEALENLEERVPDEIAGLGEPFADNVKELAEAFELSELEAKLVAFVIALQNETPVRRILCTVSGQNLTESRLFECIATALDESTEDVRKAFAPDSMLVRSGLVTLETNIGDFAADRFGLFEPARMTVMTSMRIPVQTLIAATVTEAPAAELTLKDYEQIPTVADVLIPYLKAALEGRRKGANVLLYGLPGTGKTQLARLAADQLGVRLYEVNAEEDSDDVVRRRRGGSPVRLQRWKTATAFLSTKSASLVAVDEAEDVFNDGGMLLDLFGDGSSRTNKGEINTLLESNPVPTFWITNSISRIAPSMIRRFDLVLEVPMPTEEGRRRIVEKAFAGKLSAATRERLVHAERLSPAVLNRAAAVADMAGFSEERIGEDAVVELINETMRAQRFGEVPSAATLLPADYDAHFVNADADLLKLPEGLAKAGSGRLCLYGPPGTGKSAYAAWLAARLNKPLMRKTYAELSSCYVGMTEQLIAQAFREARRTHSVLLIDEADSLLRERTLARYSWETTEVNEMLTQIENFPGFFIASTNLIDVLDAASLRRFDLKVKFDYLLPQQAVRMAEQLLASIGLKLEDEQIERISRWNKLTPGDFAAVRRQMRFNPIDSASELVDRLSLELGFKNGSASRIGFA